jgi:septum formation protein
LINNTRKAGLNPVRPSSPQLILASSSPRRRQLLEQLAVRYEMALVSVDETPGAGESAESYVQRVAAEKSRSGWRITGGRLPVLAADTEVVLDGEVLGKPRNFQHAEVMLKRLSGRSHRVLSAVSLRRGDEHWEALSVSSIWFRDLTQQEINAYLASGEPHDKAGSYAIQGRGALFVCRLEGSFSGVMGLPLFETARLLTRVGIDTATLLSQDLAANE